MHRVAARHECPFRPSNSPKRAGFQTSHPSTWHKQASGTQGRGIARPPLERASKMRKSHAPFVWKARRGGTRGPGIHPPKKWHKGVTIVDRDGVGWFPSVCLDQGLRLSLQEARSDRGRPCFNATRRNWIWFRDGTVVVFQRDIKSLT